MSVSSDDTWEKALECSRASSVARYSDGSSNESNVQNVTFGYKSDLLQGATCLYSHPRQFYTRAHFGDNLPFPFIFKDPDATAPADKSHATLSASELWLTNEKLPPTLSATQAQAALNPRSGPLVNNLTIEHEGAPSDWHANVKTGFDFSFPVIHPLLSNVTHFLKKSTTQETQAAFVNKTVPGFVGPNVNPNSFCNYLGFGKSTHPPLINLEDPSTGPNVQSNFEATQNASFPVQQPLQMNSFAEDAKAPHFADPKENFAEPVFFDNSGNKCYNHWNLWIKANGLPSIPDASVHLEAKARQREDASLNDQLLLDYGPADIRNHDDQDSGYRSKSFASEDRLWLQAALEDASRLQNKPVDTAQPYSFAQYSKFQLVPPSQAPVESLKKKLHYAFSGEGPAELTGASFLFNQQRATSGFVGASIVSSPQQTAQQGPESLGNLFGQVAPSSAQNSFEAKFSKRWDSGSVCSDSSGKAFKVETKKKSRTGDRNFTSRRTRVTSSSRRHSNNGVSKVDKVPRKLTSSGKKKTTAYLQRKLAEPNANSVSSGLLVLGNNEQPGIKACDTERKIEPRSCYSAKVEEWDFKDIAGFEKVHYRTIDDAPGTEEDDGTNDPCWLFVKKGALESDEKQDSPSQ